MRYPTNGGWKYVTRTALALRPGCRAAGEDQPLHFLLRGPQVGLATLCIIAPGNTDDHRNPRHSTPSSPIPWGSLGTAVPQGYGGRCSGVGNPGPYQDT